MSISNQIKIESLSDPSKRVSFPISHLKEGSLTDFSLYLAIDSEFVLFATSSYKWRPDEIERLKFEGHTMLYHHITDNPKVDAYRGLCKISSIDMSLEPRKRILNITDVAAELTRFLYEYPLSPSSLAKGSEIAAAMTETMIEDNSCVVALGMLASHDWYTYYHSARVASYSLALAIEMGLTDREQLEELSLGCLFHDVGKSRIDLSILNKAGPLSSGEWTLVREHPKYGIVVIDATKLGVIPREVILHHHERLDGAGYPHNLKPNELLTEVRIASFADTFDALTTNRPYQPSRTRFEALELIRNRFLAQLDPECFKAMVALFKKASHLKDAS